MQIAEVQNIISVYTRIGENVIDYRGDVKPTHLKSIEWKANAAMTALNSWPIWTYTSLTSPSDACSLLQCLRTSCNRLVENKSLRTVLGTSPGYTCETPVYESNDRCDVKKENTN